MNLHEDAAFFQAAVNFTARETSFSPRLVEKDYFCSLLLALLARPGDTVVFKGGTCLAKVHTGFYRLSEDLDFVIPVALSASRSERRALSAPFKALVAGIPGRFGTFRMVQPLVGANNSTQYIAVMAYTSLVSGQEETIKIELGQREPLLKPTIFGEARTILLNPVSGKPAMAAIATPCISYGEAMAEKLRAALSRREAAIRDFYDIDYAVRKSAFQPQEREMAALVCEKLAVPGNEPMNVAPERLKDLRTQLDAQLKPVLRTRDYAEFDLDRAFGIVSDAASGIKAESGP